jgi:hypothetical protein
MIYLMLNPGLIVLSVTSVVCTIYLFIYSSHNILEASAQLTLIPDKDQQIQTGVDTAGGQQEEEEEEVEENRGSFPALDGSFAGMISINRLVHNVNYSHFLPLSNGQGNQVKVIIDYSTISPSIIGKPINAVMEVYSLDNRSLVRTTSLPSPIIANETGRVQLATTFTDKTLTDVISIIALTDDSKSVTVSESIHFPLRFADPST